MSIKFLIDEKRFWAYDNKTGRYRDKETGKFLSKEAVLNLTEKNLQAGNAEVKGWLQEVIRGDRSLIDFSVRTAEKVKQAHIQEYLLGRGGLANAQESEYLYVGRTLKDLHYPAVKRFITDLQTGKLTEAQANYRLNLILGGAKQSYHYGEKQSRLSNGYSWGRRYLSPVIHCPECLLYAAMGVVPLSELIPPTVNCTCGGNCRCYVKYAKTPEELAG